MMLCMVRLSIWQLGRYHEKVQLIKTLERRIAEPVRPFAEVWNSYGPTAVGDLPFSRVSVSGSFDFEHEIVLRNQTLDHNPGVIVLTPFSPDGLSSRILVARGFIPLSQSARDQRSQFRGKEHVEFTAIVKQGVSRRWLAPADPPAGPHLPWVDAWLRPDITAIQNQMPYPLLPVFLEVIPPERVETLGLTIVQSHSERDEMMNMAARLSTRPKALAGASFPIPQPSLVVPAGRHKQYVFEWLVLAMLSLAVCVVIQLRPAHQTRS